MQNDIVCHEIVRRPSYWSNIFSTQIFQELLFGHSASPDNVTWWHIMARQGAMQVYVKYLDNFCHHNSLYFHHL